MTRKDEIAANLAEVKKGIAAACEQAGRDPGAVSLIAVSKNFPAEDVLHALAAGQKDFGENRVQELLPKMEALKDQTDLRWHLIGTLQRNKVKFVAGEVELIHSVNSLRLIGQIERISRQRELKSDILLQVNVSGEESKFGFAAKELEKVLAMFPAEFPSVRLRGLMTMAPWFDDPAEARPVFDQTRDLFNQCKLQYNYEHFDQLSMGMSHDYQQAIAAGSTMIRIGTAIFGTRDYAL